MKEITDRLFNRGDLYFLVLMKHTGGELKAEEAENITEAKWVSREAIENDPEYKDCLMLNEMTAGV
jgi:hypothetical protein